MDNLWRDGDAGSSDIEQLVYLSRLIGSDQSLVQTGGGNTSVKLEEGDAFGCTTRALVVKGSGTDLRTIGAQGLAHLYLDRLAVLRDRRSLSDEEMMQLLRACMLYPERDPLPSVETPLHSLLPFRFIAHTHDVATLSLTDTPHAEEHVRRAFGDEVAFLEYVRPGFPLARRLAERYAGGPPEGAFALVMEKHGLAAWGESAKECYVNLCSVIDKAEALVAERRKGKRVFGPATSPALTEPRRQELAAALLPVIRGQQSRGWRPVIHFDDSPEVLEAIGCERFPEVAARGVMTPEHILRAGKKPLVLALDFKQDVESLKERARQELRDFRETYLQQAREHGVSQPTPDFVKTIIVPGMGIVYAGKDKRNALVAAECYRASMQAIAGAEAVEKFEFLSEEDAWQMEYWPLERRKTEEAGRGRRDLEGSVAIVIGAAGGIGHATAVRLAEEGAHVVLADIDADAVNQLTAEINDRSPERAVALSVDVCDAAAVETAFREAVLHFGGIDVLFYSPGIAPELHSVTEIAEAEVERQMQVHFRGAVAATRAATRTMLDQGYGGRLIYNASKAAYVPGEGAAAYGASKAALVHYVRNVASELGRYGITANYINADAVDTPLFQALLRQRAEQAEKIEEEMLKRYAERSVFHTPTVPPEAVADAVLFLASDRAAYTTGCVITIGGGAEGFPR